MPGLKKRDDKQKEPVTDEKGRLPLGIQFASRRFIVEENENGTITATPSTVVPDHELWLLRNKAARASVEEGIAQAQAGNLNDGPDLEAARKFADSIPDE